MKRSITIHASLSHCYTVGESIVHSKFGEGTIQRIRLDDYSIYRYNNEDYLIEVYFKDFGLKTLSLNLCLEGGLLKKTASNRNIIQAAS